jgi:hypothetical protein
MEKRRFSVEVAVFALILLFAWSLCVPSEGAGKNGRGGDCTTKNCTGSDLNICAGTCAPQAPRCCQCYGDAYATCQSATDLCAMDPNAPNCYCNSGTTGACKCVGHNNLCGL